MDTLTTYGQSNRITKQLQKDKKLLSIYFTAGYPEVNDTVPILEKLQDNGVDMIEIGLPFSDPLADGPTIQKSSTAALKNGFTTALLFEQLENIREKIHVPLILMGYFNPMMQYGVEAFCRKCAEIGIDGLIIPDLPVDEYDLQYRSVFEKHGLINVFLITPQTSEERIRYIDSVSNGFIYMVSSASVTGSTSGFGTAQSNYFERIDQMNLNSPQIVGFGIKDAQTYREATRYAKGAIIGSAFIKMLSAEGVEGIPQFIRNIR